jgi:3-dehydroquinate synthase
MYEVLVEASASRYRVSVGRGCYSEGIAKADFFVVDEFLRGSISTDMVERTVFVEASEPGKSLATCELVLERLHAMGARRGATLAAVGGGVVQDVATLVASLYMRGLPWLYVPTTAMAMTDSCIGGKSSINLKSVKNLVGNIYPPTAVFVDPAFLNTLPLAGKVAGLAEAVKICFARGDDAFDEYLELGLDCRQFGDDARTDALIAHTLLSKKWFIEIDEFDKKERQLLNFGHSFAHALEPAVGFAIPHGVAVALGVLAALEHPQAVSTPSTARLAAYCRELMNAVPECLNAAMANYDGAVFRAAIASDKKNTTHEMRLVLPQGDGALELISIERSTASIDDAEHAMVRALTGSAA